MSIETHELPRPLVPLLPGLRILLLRAADGRLSEDGTILREAGCPRSWFVTVREPVIFEGNYVC
jgi:hypothetical protein